MNPEESDYEHYTRSNNSTLKYVLLAIVIVVVGGTLTWLASRNHDLAQQNQQLYESGGTLYTPNPHQDLNVSLDAGSNLVGVPILKGAVYNGSDRTTYKNVVVAIEYFTSDDQLIGRENISAAYKLSPGAVAEIRHKPQVKAYRKADRFRMQLMEATAD